MKKCSITGNRPYKFPWLYGVGQEHERYLKRLNNVIEQLILGEDVDFFYCGMATGADMDVAEIVIALREKYPSVQLHGVIPCRDQCKYWDSTEIERYNRILSLANSFEVLADHYTKDCMFARNRYMVDHSDIIPFLFAFFGNIKHESWRYENEFRCSVSDGKTYMPANPKAIYIGANCAEDRRRKLIEIGHSLQVPVYQMFYEPLSPEFGFIPKKADL